MSEICLDFLCPIKSCISERAKQDGHMTAVSVFRSLGRGPSYTVIPLPLPTLILLFANSSKENNLPHQLLLTKLLRLPGEQENRYSPKCVKLEMKLTNLV